MVQNIGYYIKEFEGNEEWPNGNSEELTRMGKITGQETCSSTGCMKSKEEMMIIEKEKNTSKMKIHRRTLPFRKRKTRNAHKYRGTRNIKDWSEISIGKIKQEKETGPDEIVIEMLADLDDFCIDKIRHKVNKIYQIADIQEDQSRSIAIVLLKKPNANECKTPLDIETHNKVQYPNSDEQIT